MNRRAALGVMCVAGAAAMSPRAFACGFESPAMLERGMLNWMYPKSLYVDTAVWRAQAAGLIEKEPPLKTTRLFINPGYRKAVKALETFASRLPADEQQASFVVLLMEAMLWTRVHPGSGKPIEPHVMGTGPGETLLITQRVVLDALNGGGLSPGQAEDLGLFRLYGAEGAVTQLRASLGRAAQLALK